jgi:hypothetical protein
MFWFWKRNKNSFNKIELTHFIFNKTESIYSLNEYFNFDIRPKTYGINTVIKNVPVYIENGKVFARVRYIGMPDGTAYFILNISNIEKEYISDTNTVDIILNATIKDQKCTNYKFKLSPIYERRAITC